jgi:uncharacterized membrane protein YeaQ/YmgE (transglycosylase-associated protein family)
MHILYMLVIGLIIGALAKAVMPGRDPGGLVITILLGLTGSVLAGYIGRAMNWYSPEQPAGILASVGGAVLLLVIYRAIVMRRRVS